MQVMLFFLMIFGCFKAGSLSLKLILIRISLKALCTLTQNVKNTTRVTFFFVSVGYFLSLVL